MSNTVADKGLTGVRVGYGLFLLMKQGHEKNRSFKYACEGYLTHVLADGDMNDGTVATTKRRAAEKERQENKVKVD